MGASWGECTVRQRGERLNDVCTSANTCAAPQVRVAVIGNVDSGKSTMVGVLTRSMLDDGRGLARSKVRWHGPPSSCGCVLLRERAVALFWCACPAHPHA